MPILPHAPAAMARRATHPHHPHIPLGASTSPSTTYHGPSDPPRVWPATATIAPRTRPTRWGHISAPSCQGRDRGFQGLFKVGERAEGAEGGKRLGAEEAGGRRDLGGAEGADQADGGVAEGGHGLGGVAGANAGAVL